MRLNTWHPPISEKFSLGLRSKLAGGVRLQFVNSQTPTHSWASRWRGYDSDCLFKKKHDPL